jgi:uncharacterized protein YkwD
MKQVIYLSPMVLLILAACQMPTPSAPVAQAPATSHPIVQAATSTAVPPSPTALPTTAPTQAPTATATAAAAILPTPTATPAPATCEVYVNGDGVNFRDAPGTTATVLQVLPQGTHLIALDQPTAPDAAGITWQNVRTDAGQSGWIAAQLLSDATPTPTPAPSPTGAPADTSVVSPIAPADTSVVSPIASAGYVYVISVDGLNLRADHSVSSNVIAQLANGQRVQTNGLGFGPDDQGIQWLNIKTDDEKEGWVAADYVSTEVPSVKPAEPPANEQAVADELLRRTNALRQQNGLPPYTVDTGLTTMALAHSEYMSQNGLTHNDAEGRSASKRLANWGYRGQPTENIYFGSDIETVWEYWATDLPHRQNLLNPVNTVIGIGVLKVGCITYFTQDFAIPPQ